VVVRSARGAAGGGAVSGCWPELAVELGWTTSLVLFAAGYGLLLAINRFAYPVCPTCAHITTTTPARRNCTASRSADCGGGRAQLMDGWSVATVQLTVPLGPEGGQSRLAVASLHNTAGRHRRWAGFCGRR